MENWFGSIIFVWFFWVILISLFSRGIGFFQFLLLWLFLIYVFWFHFQGQLGKQTKTTTCCKQGLHKLVTWDQHLWHLGAPALPGAGTELGTIPRGGTKGSPPLCDLFLPHQDLPALLPVQSEGSLAPHHGCTWDNDRKGRKRC